MSRLAFVISFTLGAALISGCSTPQNAPPPPTGTVKGTVMMDGKPMESGEIHFNVPGQAPKSAPITKGEFSGEAFVGKNQVEVMLMKDGPPSTTDPKDITKINMVAEKYWGPTTTLSAEVTKQGATGLKFEVTSK